MKNVYFPYKKYQYADEPRLSYKEILDAVSAICNMQDYKDKLKVREILAAYNYVVHQALVIGYKFQIPTVGSFCHYVQRGKAKGRFYNISTREYEEREETLPFKRPYFKFAPKIKLEIRDATRGLVELDTSKNFASQEEYESANFDDESEED